MIECDLPLGRPGLVVHNELLLSGWAAGPTGVTGVVVDVDERTWTAGYGLDTPGLRERLPSYKDADQAGYRLWIDTSTWSPGSRHVAVATYTEDGRRYAIEGEIDVQPFSPRGSDPVLDTAALGEDVVALKLDAPDIEDGVARIEAPLEVRGWAHAGEGIETVLVTIDGVHQYEALRPVARPELVEDLGRGAAKSAGFCLLVDPVEYAAGTHKLSVVALTGTGRVSGTECEFVWVPPDTASTAGGLEDSDRDDGVPARRNDCLDAADPNRPWEDRALVAEADAAMSRTEARLAISGQEHALRQLRHAEGDAGALVERPRSELAAARQRLKDLRVQFEEVRRREEHARREADEKAEEWMAGRSTLETTRSELESALGDLRDAGDRLAQQNEAMASLVNSASWRLTKPLRATKRLLRQVAGRSMVGALALFAVLAIGLSACASEEPADNDAGASSVEGSYRLGEDGGTLIGDSSQGLRVRSGAVAGFVDNVIPEGDAVNITGWASTADHSAPAELVVGIVEGRGVSETTPSAERPDLVKAFGTKAIERSGFVFFVETSALDCSARAGGLTVFGVVAGEASPLQFVGNSRRELESC